MGKERENQDDTSSFLVSDRRFWVENEASLDGASEPETRYPSFVEELKARTEAAEEKLKERLQQLDEENASFRDRLNRNLDKRLDEEKAEFLSSLLEVIDNLERAIQAAQETSNLEGLLDGVKLNLELLLKKFRYAGAEPIDNYGEAFDPNIAEALGVVAVSEPDLDQKVVEVIQKGYRLGDRIIRPAMVNVGMWQEEK